MIWRRCTEADTNAILRISREPMGGTVRLAWGFSELRSPVDCENFRAYAVETEHGVTGCALGWDWPGGSRYLSGLRFGREMRTRPRPAFWTRAFKSILEGVSHGWTSIGAENLRARKILESGAKWLPRYEPRQKITTSFVPLAARQAGLPRSPEFEAQLGLQAAAWRHLAIVSGEGCAYRIGRLLNKAGCPGIPAPNRPIRIAYYHPSHEASVPEMRRVWREATGYDGIVVVIPEGSGRARRLAEAVPRRAWKWASILYSVSWKDQQPPPAIPDWKGIWL